MTAATAASQPKPPRARPVSREELFELFARVRSTAYDLGPAGEEIDRHLRPFLRRKVVSAKSLLRWLKLRVGVAMPVGKLSPVNELDVRRHEEVVAWRVRELAECERRIEAATEKAKAALRA